VRALKSCLVSGRHTAFHSQCLNRTNVSLDSSVQARVMVAGPVPVVVTWAGAKRQAQSRSLHIASSCLLACKCRGVVSLGVCPGSRTTACDSWNISAIPRRVDSSSLDCSRRLVGASVRCRHLRHGTPRTGVLMGKAARRGIAAAASHPPWCASHRTWSDHPNLVPISAVPAAADL